MVWREGMMPLADVFHRIALPVVLRVWPQHVRADTGSPGRKWSEQLRGEATGPGPGITMGVVINVWAVNIFWRQSQWDHLIENNSYNASLQSLYCRKLLGVIRTAKIWKISKERWELPIKMDMSSRPTASVMKKVTKKEGLIILWRIEETMIKCWFDVTQLMLLPGRQSRT